jgi:hypothetical protein
MISHQKGDAVMGRPVDPTAPFRVKLHRIGQYMYASTQASFIYSKTGKRTHRCIHWGKVDKNLKSIPGPTFLSASSEEQASLIFPENWDLSEVSPITDLNSSSSQERDKESQTRLYGDIWLLEQVAEQTGIRQDLKRYLMEISQ